MVTLLVVKAGTTMSKVLVPRASTVAGQSLVKARFTLFRALEDRVMQSEACPETVAVPAPLSFAVWACNSMLRSGSSWFSELLTITRTMEQRL